MLFVLFNETVRKKREMASDRERLRYCLESPARKEEEKPMAKKKRSGMRYKLKTKQVKVNRVRAKRNYKDTVFRMLFSDKKNLLDLYNAVSGKAYTEPGQLQIVTLENAVYMGMKNDLAFIIDTNLFLYEHQSTYNPNIPLRDLFYVASEYQKLVDRQSLYSSKLQKIPAPKFLVFYNGKEEMEDSRTEYLSEAFENLIGEPDLELKVLTLNINDGHNKELLEQCKVLKEYAQYVDRVRKYVGKMKLDAAVHRAVDECIREGILEDFLHANRAEVEKVSIFEYDKEEEERKLRKAEYEAGREDGEAAGRVSERQEILNLMNKLTETGCIEELKRAIEDEEYRAQLMKELNMEISDKIL